jgi:hypothetical protein
MEDDAASQIKECMRADGMHEDPAAPTSVVLCNLWIVGGSFRSLSDARPNHTEMDKLSCCESQPAKWDRARAVFLQRWGDGLFNHYVPPSEEN